MGIGSSQDDDWKGYDDQLFKDEVMQSYLVPDTAEKGTSPIIRNKRAEKEFYGYLKDKDGKSLDTGWKMFESSVAANGDKPFIGYRPFLDPADSKKRGKYEWMSYNEFREMVVAFGNGLASLDLAEKSTVGIFAANRPEWYFAHIGNMSQSYRTVALYDTLGAQAVAFIVQHAHLPVILVEKNKLGAMEEAVKSARARAEEEKSDELELKYVIQIDYNKRFGNEHEKVEEADVKRFADLGLQLIGFSELLEKGKDGKKFVLPGLEDIAYIMYTSGTTGDPKGVMLPHRSFAAAVASGSREIATTAEDVHVSYLPLAHIFEALAHQMFASSGSRIAYWGGDIRKIALDWKEIRPTVVIGVPRVFGKTYDKFKMKTKEFGTIKKWFVNSAEESSQALIRQGKRSSFYDKTVWSTVAPEMGFNRVRLVVSGAAPLPPHIAEFLRIILPGAVVIQGYGMTENCAAGMVVQKTDITLGHVGIPTDNNEVRLIDAPECGYLVSDKPYIRGEIQFRGPLVMRGYYRNEESTKKTISEEGWLSTGDIGRINPNGTVSVIDRRKNMFKTAMGEYIASEKVESVYLRCSSIAQMYLYGNGFKSFVVAVVVPDAQVFESLFKERGAWPDKSGMAGTQAYADTWAKVAKDNLPFVHDFIMKEMSTVDKELKKFEKVKDIFIETTIDELMAGFTVENGLLTPTFKSKRPQLKGRYIEDIKEMYKKNGEAPKESENWTN